MKPYVFNNQQLTDINMLGEAYIESFDLAMDDIFKNAKKLIKFVKKSTKDKALVKEIASYLYGCHYKNSALSLIIFKFTKKVIINGVELSLEDFCQVIKENKDNCDAIKGFVRDGGLTKTYKILHPDHKMLANSEYIEKYWDSDFTYKYLGGYLDYQETESLNGKISSVAIGMEECFRRATKIAKDEDVQIQVAHKAGFKAAIGMHNSINPLFEFVKILHQKQETDEELLKRVIDDTFYWWLLENLEKYLATKKEARYIFEDLVELKKKYQSYLDLIASKKIYAISMDEYADMAKDLYVCYLEFVDLYRKGKIIVKKRFDQARFDLNKPYCMTYICQDYMDGRVIKLYTKDEPKDEEPKINPLTGEVIEEDESVQTKKHEQEDAPLDDVAKRINLKKLDKNKKKLSKNKRFAIVSMLASICTLGFVILMITISTLSELLGGKLDKFVSNIDLVNDNPTAFLVGTICSGLIIVFGLVLCYLITKTKVLIDDVKFVANSDEVLKMLPADEKKTEQIKLNIEKNEKKALNAHRAMTCIICILLGLAYAIVALYFVAIADQILKLNKFEAGIKSNLVYITVGAGAGVGLLYGLIKKYKGILSIILLFFIIFVVVFGAYYVL